jgi:gas vesicle protein
MNTRRRAKIMKEELTNRKGSILTPVLAGGALGAGLGLLLAPQSGNETRNDIKRIANRASHAVSIGKDLYGESKAFVNEAIDAGKKAFVEEKPLAPIHHGRNPLLVPVIVAAGIVGAGIALLLAPKAGNEIRDDLKRFASSSRDRVVSAIDKGKDLYIAGKGTISGAVEAGKKVYTDVKERVTH